jgi:hypothetical protein
MTTITTPQLNPGETYAGALINPDGTGHHIIILPTLLPKLTWDKSLKAAADAGGDLPSRPEAAHIFAQVKERPQSGWHWTNEQYAGNTTCAWLQYFSNGDQIDWLKDGEFPALLVRREAIR